MSKKKITGFCFFLFCFLLMPPTALISHGQETVKQKQSEAANIELLIDEIEKQKTQIQQLQAQLEEESELRKQQQILLEKLIHKLERPDASLAKNTSVNDKISVSAEAVSEKPSADLQTKTDVKTNKQQDKSQAVESGFGKVKFNGMIQLWYQGGDGNFADSFRIRRAEMRFTGDLLPKVRWTVMLDLAKALSLNTNSNNVNGVPVLSSASVNQSSRVLQEAFITFSHFKRANINVGQFKLPISQEALQSSSSLDTVERALFLTDRSRGGGLGDVRDLGVMLFGSLNKQTDYQIGIFNGSGETQNDVSRNDAKAIAGRFVFRPKFIKGLQVGASGVWGNSNVNRPRRDRLGAEMVFQRDRLKLKSEFMTGVDGEIHRRGFYAHAGYRFIPKLEGILRFDMFDPDIRRETNSANVTERDFIAGINYYIKDNNLKLQFNYVRKTFAHNIVQPRNLFLVNLQTSW